VTLVLYYHQLSDDASPLAVSPSLFSRHLDVLHECEATVLTAHELAVAHDAGAIPERGVAITFDDGFATAVAEARARLAEHGFRATFFCVAGHLGGLSDWPSRLPGAPVEPLADVDALRSLVADGHEIGSHGWRHAPLDADADLHAEVVESRELLESTLGSAVRTFAYPYGAKPTDAARSVVERTYDAAFTTTVGRVTPASRRALVPRVDAHYLRDPRLLRRVVGGSLDTYLGARRLGARTRRVVRRDYVGAGAR
jgi:peptidoglycan/xylan/chitin deacetylase (PgdA/CDA1 family)